MKKKKKFWKFYKLDDQVMNRWQLFKKLCILWIFSNISQGNSEFLVEQVKSPSHCKEIKPVTPKGNHSEYSLEGLMLKPKL